ncbi:MAG TPA: glycine zipper 2TM domain-containing protein [Halothiobacillus sp.]|nr:glycine zipper 2TM domain-containing protein [Halothiobacillus sp.]
MRHRISKPFFRIAIISIALGFLAGCASSMSGSAYSRSEARSAMDVQYGTVQSVRSVLIEGTKTPIGAGAGAAIGGLLGSTVGGGTGRDLATVGGAVAGGLAGAAIEEGITRQQGLEITVRLDNGRTIAVVQAADQQFLPGDRVQVSTTRDGRTRVSK